MARCVSGMVGLDWLLAVASRMQMCKGLCAVLHIQLGIPLARCLGMLMDSSTSCAAVRTKVYMPVNVLGVSKTGFTMGFCGCG